MAQSEDNTRMRPKSARAASDPTIAPPYHDDTSSDRIRNDIRDTRRDMDQTVDQLSDRLRPRHLLDEVLDWWQQRSGGSSESLKGVGMQVGNTLRQHPISAALIGAGIAYMFFEGEKHVTRRDYRPRKWDVDEYSGSYVDARTGEPYDASYGDEARYSTGAEASDMSGEGGIEGLSGGITDKAKTLASDAKEKAKEVASAMREKGRRWKEGVRERGAGVSERGREYASRAGEYASRAGQSMRRGYETSSERVADAMDEYPLAAGAAAMAAGLIAGLLLPNTRREDEMMGRYSSDLKRRARETGEDLYERGKDIASSTAQAVGGEVEKQGLGPNELLEKGKRIASDVARAASESAEREGLNPDQLGEKARNVANEARETAKQKTQQQKDDLQR